MDLTNEGNKDLTWQAAAAANLLAARKKHGRYGGKKSRSGCTTCRQRRVKCDESQPNCHACLRTGRKCLQLSQSLGLKEADVRTFDYFLTWTAPRLAGSLDKDFWCEQVLQQAHSEPIVRDALLALSILYEHPQFIKSFLTASSTTDPIRRVFATSKLRSDLLQDSSLKHAQGQKAEVHPSIQTPPMDDNHIRALRHYNRSIAGLNKCVASGQATPQLALVSCLLFVCIELSRDNMFAVLGLLMQATKLLQSNSKTGGPIDGNIHRSVAHAFARLGAVAIICGYPRRLDLPFVELDLPSEVGYASLQDARMALYTLIADGHAIMHETMQQHQEQPGSSGFKRLKIPSYFSNATRLSLAPESDMQLLESAIYEDEQSYSPEESMSHSGTSTPAATEIPPCHPMSDAIRRPGCISYVSNSVQLSQPPEPGFLLPKPTEPSDSQPSSPTVSSHIHLASLPILEQQQADHAAKLRTWRQALTHTPGYNTDDEASSCLLMHYHITVIWLHTWAQSEQTSFDAFYADFAEVVRLAAIHLRARSPEKPSFSLEMGAISPLWFTATKCRYPALRRRAVELMWTAPPMKDCVWGSQSCAELAARIIQIEEELLSTTGIAIPNPSPAPKSASILRLPSEERRIQSLDILKNLTNGQLELRITRVREQVPYFQYYPM